MTLHGVLAGGDAPRVVLEGQEGHDTDEGTPPLVPTKQPGT
jgi:hypothetical protein